MDGSFDAVKHFQVKFGKLVFLVGRGLLDITQGGGIDNVSYDEALDGLVFGNGLAGGNATNAFDVAASVFVAAVIASFDSHDDERMKT
mmetsp:Transcript_26785/g.47614  ORF Transcript_26785/g.47614 Transcript_26785/m.47614 type:complete len:88 (-) Transcript_26785:101-364(-)